MDNNSIKIAKGLKKDFVEITPSYILGTDLNRCTMSIVYEGDEDYYIGTVAELEGKKVPDFWMPADRLKRDINNLKNNCFSILEKRQILLSEKDLKENESFMLAQAMKASNGAVKFLSGADFLMYLYSSLHPINKPDSVTMNIYRYDDISYLAEYIISKKKFVINEYIRYLYL